MSLQCHSDARFVPGASRDAGVAAEQHWSVIRLALIRRTRTVPTSSRGCGSARVERTPLVHRVGPRRGNNVALRCLGPAAVVSRSCRWCDVAVLCRCHCGAPQPLCALVALEQHQDAVSAAFHCHCGGTALSRSEPCRRNVTRVSLLWRSDAVPMAWLAGRRPVAALCH